jgi:hypothetical protein
LVYEEKDWRVDLSLLESFVPLQHIEIVLMQRGRSSKVRWMKPDPGNKACLLARKAALLLLTRELKRIVGASVSGKGGMRSKEWYEERECFTLGKDGRPESWLMKWCLNDRRAD